MKKWNMILMIAMTGVCAQPAFAISEAYRAQLEQSGCTQVSEANGTCEIKPARYRHGQDVASYRDHRDATHEILQDLDSHIAGDYQGEAVDYMEGSGWHAMNDEHTRWRKSGVIVEFDMSPSGRIAGVTIN
ncbi:hypothetical protein [Aeromonas intestinalis]